MPKKERDESRIQEDMIVLGLIERIPFLVDLVECFESG